jgi:DNA end-binding protein Ku
VTTFEPSKFEDTYEDALIAMIDAKRKGKKPPKPAPRPKDNVINLAEVLRRASNRRGWRDPRTEPHRNARQHS